MTSGSMAIRNYLGGVTVLQVSGIGATADNDNSLQDARASLTREKSSPSPSTGNIAFLTHWIRLYLEAEVAKTKESEVPPPLPEPQPTAQEVQQLEQWEAQLKEVPESGASE